MVKKLALDNRTVKKRKVRRLPQTPVLSELATTSNIPTPTPRIAKSTPIQFVYNSEHMTYQFKKNRRIAIVSTWQAMGAPPECYWSGIDGTISSIVKEMTRVHGFIDHKVVGRALSAFKVKYDVEEVYCGKVGAGRGRKAQLDIRSFAGKYVIDLLEMGYSY